MQHFRKAHFFVKKSLKILQFFAKILLNLSPTTDRAPTTLRLLSTTGREACTTVAPGVEMELAPCQPVLG